MTVTPVTSPGSSATYRNFMRGFPTGVAVVTTLDGRDRPVGFTCSSLSGVSLEPPMLLVCVNNVSTTLAQIRAREVFAVNLLSQRGRAAAEQFAAPGHDQSDRGPWRPTATWALPWLAEAAHAVSECRVVTMIEAGDHTIVVGAVETVTTSDDDPTPLLHGFGRYKVWPESA